MLTRRGVLTRGDKMEMGPPDEKKEGETQKTTGKEKKIGKGKHFSWGKKGSTVDPLFGKRSHLTRLPCMTEGEGLPLREKGGPRGKKKLICRGGHAFKVPGMRHPTASRGNAES